MKIGISRPTGDSTATREMLAEAVKHGFEGVQFKEAQYRLDTLGASEFRNTYGGHARLAAGGLIAYPPWEIPGWKKHLLPIFEFAAAIGAPHVCICCSVQRSSNTAPGEVAALLNELGSHAGRFGVRISLHNHADSMFETGDDLAAVAETLDPARCGLTIDTGHLVKVGVTDIPPILHRFRHLLLNVHLKDLDAQGNFCPLGAGIASLEPALATLREMNYDEWLIVDEESVHVPLAEAFRITRAFLDKQETA